MALQDPNVLAMVRLGTLDDSPENALQPKLVNAVHLRWAFRPDLGFPWHGFYLFRRNSKLRQSSASALVSRPPARFDERCGLGERYWPRRKRPRSLAEK